MKQCERPSTICHVIDYGGLTAGSFIAALQSLAEELARHGSSLVVFATDIPGALWPKELAGAGVDVRLIRDNRELFQGLRQVKPDVVHSHFTRYDLPIMRAARGARIFWHIHSYRETRSAAARLRAFVKYRILGKEVEGMIAVSRAIRQDCLAWFAPRDRVRVIYNGIDVHRFRPPTAAERNAARERFGIIPQEQVVLFFERVPLKGGAVLREALRRIPHCRLLIAGGKKADRDRFGRWPHVISVDREADARQLYWAADALAFASSGEAFGLVLTEALACGLPIAASDIPVVHEICNGTEMVYIFPVGDSDALAHALELAMACKQRESGRLRVVERFSLERWTRDMLALYSNAFDP